jgi:hypothetical protein
VLVAVVPLVLSLLHSGCSAASTAGGDVSSSPQTPPAGLRGVGDATTLPAAACCGSSGPTGCRVQEVT